MTPTGSGRRRRWAAVLAAVTMLAGACGGGGDGGEDATGTGTDDPIDEVATTGERPVQVTGAGKVRLGGTLVVPPAAGVGTKVPGVVIVPTLGAGNRNGMATPASTTADPIGRDLAQTMANAGVASYRYDRRGTGESKLQPDVKLSFDDMVADAKAAVDLLAQRKETSGADLAVVGYDQGGLVALRLAATDNRIKRVVLISTPGRPLVEVQAAELTARYGLQSGEALRAAVSGVLANHTVPALAELPTELRPLLPAGETALLEQLYRLDPAAEAATVTASALVVAPANSHTDPNRLVQALRRAEFMLPAPDAGPTLLIVRPPPSDDRSDAMSPAHEHGVPQVQVDTDRDQATLERLATWLRAGGPAPGPS